MDQKPSKGKDIAIAILCFISGVLLACVIALFIGRGATVSQTANVLPQVQPQITTADANSDFTITQDPGNPDQNIFTSAKLGISFSYLKYGYSYDENNHGIDRSSMINPPKLNGNTISFGPTYSSFISIYQKQSGQSLESAIQSQFLQNIPATSCIASRVQYGSDQSFYPASSTISYVRLNSVKPNGCPSQFDFSNPSASFISFSNQPNTFFYVIGENDTTMPLMTSNGDPFWTTMKFLTQ